MPLAKSKNAVGLGNSLMNDRFGKGRSNMHKGNAKQGAIRRTDQFGNEYLTNNKKEADWVKMRSVTEQGALDEFLSTAELAGTDFTAEKMNNVKIIHTDQKNPYLLSREEERGAVRKMNAKRARLTVPRRPAWNENTTPAELDERERQSLLDWRRGLAELQEIDDLLMTPFERNLEVWRQLWRVIERSDLVVQIVDARNPLLFRSDDLEKYVKEVSKAKRNLLLINKADMMTLEQRKVWAEYLVEKGINFRFFSAELAKELNEAREGESDEETSEEDSEDDRDSEEEQEDDVPGKISRDEIEEELDSDADEIAKQARKIDLQDQKDRDEEWADEESNPQETPELDGVPLPVEERTNILTTSDLEALFLQHSPARPDQSDSPGSARKTSIGLVGYPNVGKSSTINALLGAKKVSVSATPGKTKHFQTIHLSDKVILCDCPGLVFPNFAFTKAELVCSGVLPIDQLREYTGPASLVSQRIPKAFLEAVYGLTIRTRAIDEGGTGIPTGDELCRAYARARGFFTTGKGTPDESRAARLILKDYVKGKLLFVHPPPQEPSIDSHAFNRELYDLNHLPQKRRAAVAASTETVLNNTSDPSLMDDPDIIPLPKVQGGKSSQLDKQFFGPGNSGGKVVQPFHYKYSEQGQGKQLSGRKLKEVVAMEKGIDPSELKGGKKHFKGNKRGKHRTETKDDD